MAETSVEYIRGEQYLTWYSDEPKWANRIRQLAVDNADVQIIADDGEGVLAHCPISWFKPPRPPIKRNMTDEQRQAAADRLRNQLNNRKN